jgi:hypothetical protein
MDESSASNKASGPGGGKQSCEIISILSNEVAKEISAQGSLSYPQLKLRFSGTK